MSESPKFYQITKKYKSRFEKRKDRLASRSTAYCFRKTEERYPYVTAAAAQQQLSSSSSSSRSSSGGGGGGGGEGGVGGGSTASLFCTAVAVAPERRGHIKNMVDTSSPRLISNSILVHMFWPPLLLDLLLLCRRRRRRRYCCCCCCCCAVTRFCVRSEKHKMRNSLL